jgi:peptide/nickel transport system permease protein
MPVQVRPCMSVQVRPYMSVQIGPCMSVQVGPCMPVQIGRYDSRRGSLAVEVETVLAYIVRRIILAIPTILLISVIAFLVIELPPGSWVDNYVAQLTQTGQRVSQEELASLKLRYGLDAPVLTRYWKWVTGWFRLDFGRSFHYNMPVLDLIASRLVFSVILAFSGMLFIYLVSIPIAMISATHQYSATDYAATFVGFAGLAIPNFLLALILMFFFFQVYGLSPGGLVSPEYRNAPWTLAKLWDIFKHLWIPVIVIGTGGTASTIRVLRATLLDELGKNYVQTARAKGLSERIVLYKHVLRVAINPLLSGVIWELPRVISGATITATVLSLPVLGEMLLTGLRTQDMYLAGTCILFQSLLVAVGALVSDILLAVADPRIKYGA